MLFSTFMSLQVYRLSCTTKIQTISRTCNTKCKNLTYLTQNLPPFHNVSKSIINASKTISYITLPLTNPKL